ncbi:MAG: glycosyltransferase [Oscillospiraceae bacterium]
MIAPSSLHVLFLSSYSFPASGLASFTRDLVQELAGHPDIYAQIVAIDGGTPEYPKEVVAHFEKKSRFAHLAAADFINRSGADVLVVQHSFEIYGGRYGDYLLDLLGQVEIPYLLVCHDVPSVPCQEQRNILSKLCYFSHGTVVMSLLAKRLLVTLYGCSEGPIHALPHGVPAYKADREKLKAMGGLGGKTVLVSYGLLCPEKGLEYGIDAVAQVAEKHPDIHYLILGSLHPRTRPARASTYRQTLQDKVQALGLEGHVTILSRFFSKAEMLRLLALSDICLAPYLTRDISISGTLANAVGLGRAVVSTPFLYAQEILAEGRGLLAQMSDADSLARCITTLLEVPQLKAHIERQTAALGEKMAWPHVACQYSALLGQVAERHAREVAS